MCGDTMKKVGITGGIGCGKSTVAAEFRKLGVPCFIADIVASTYYLDYEFLDEVSNLLGADVLLPDGSADKAAIARKVFADRNLLNGLNAIIHPRVMQDFAQFCHRYASLPYVLFESAILYESGLDTKMDSVICVYLDLEERLSRLMQREGGDEQAIRARIANQMPAEEVMDRADYVILNYEGNPRSRQVAYIDGILRNKKS